MKIDSRKCRTGGFTLIEVMVATGILLVLVMMVGGLFTQASSIWDAGYVRAEGGMVARAIIGSIQRDLQTAVDGRAFDGLGFSDSPVKSGNGQISFVAMVPVDKTVGNSPATRDRGFHLITYSLSRGSVRRSDQPVVSSSRDSSTGRAKWTAASGTSSVIYGGSDGSEGAAGADEASAQNSSSFQISDIGLVYGDSADSSLRKSFESGNDHGDFDDYVAWGGASGAPSWCRVRVVVSSQGSKTGLEVKSVGGKRPVVAR